MFVCRFIWIQENLYFFLTIFSLCYRNYKERKTRLKKRMSYKSKKTLCIVRYMVGSVIPNLYASRKVNIKLKKLRKYTGCLMFRIWNYRS